MKCTNCLQGVKSCFDNKQVKTIAKAAKYGASVALVGASAFLAKEVGKIAMSTILAGSPYGYCYLASLAIGAATTLYYSVELSGLRNSKIENAAEIILPPLEKEIVAFSNGSMGPPRGASQ